VLTRFNFNLTFESIDKKAGRVYNSIRKKREGNNTMTTYQLVKITNSATTVNPWVVGGLIALTVAFAITAVVVIVKTKL